MITTINEFKNSINENKKQSLCGIDLYNLLKTKSYIKYIDRPSGEFHQDIDLVLITESYFDELSKFIKSKKWYISRTNNKISLTISQYYIEEAIRTTPNVLYHITPTKNISSILKNGLKPKEEDIRHKYPPRIYVSDNINTLINLSKEMITWKGKEEYSIIEINTLGLDILLYKDSTSAYKGHFYIQDIIKIPPTNIILYENIIND